MIIYLPIASIIHPSTILVMSMDDLGAMMNKEMLMILNA